MDTMFVTAAMSTPSLVLRYAAAFFFVVVAIFMAYALFKAAKALERADKVLADVDENGIPLMRKAGAFSAGVKSAVSSFMKRDKSGDAASGGSGAGSAGSAAGDAPPAGGWG